MTTDTLPPITPVGTPEINALLDAYRKRHGITSDRKLGQLLGMSGQAIYRWRRGEVDRAARIFLTMEREITKSPESAAA